MFITSLASSSWQQAIYLFLLLTHAYNDFVHNSVNVALFLIHSFSEKHMFKFWIELYNRIQAIRAFEANIDIAVKFQEQWSMQKEWNNKNRNGQQYPVMKERYQVCSRQLSEITICISCATVECTFGLHVHCLVDIPLNWMLMQLKDLPLLWWQA